MRDLQATDHLKVTLCADAPQATNHQPDVAQGGPNWKIMPKRLRHCLTGRAGQRRGAAERRPRNTTWYSRTSKPRKASTCLTCSASHGMSTMLWVSSSMK